MIFRFFLIGLFGLGGLVAGEDGPDLLVESVRLGLEDGVELGADVYRPNVQAKVPAILYITPYRRAQEAPKAKFFAANRYAMAVVSVRGSGDSQGRFRPFINEIPDLQGILNWALKQPWCDGRVGLYGTSSSSYSAQLLASTQHPAVKALVNVSGLTDTEELFFPGGAFRLNTLYPWLHFFYLRKPMLSLKDWNHRFEQLPLASGYEWSPGLLERMAKNTVATDRIQIPILHFTGWNDVVYRQTLFLYERVAAKAKPTYQQMMIGPWAHNYIGSEKTEFGGVEFGTEARVTRLQRDQQVLKFFDHFIKGEPNLDTQSNRVRYFVMGLNKWMSATSWPPPEAKKRLLFLTAGDKELPRRGGLSWLPPKKEAVFAYQYDPTNPVPTYGGVNSHIFPKLAGPLDQRRFLDRQDVLVFSTPILENPLMLAGSMKAVVYASTSGVDTDFTAKLIDIHPDGTHRIIEDGIIRGKYRQGRDRPAPVQAGKVYSFEIDLGWTALQLKPGHRLSLHLSSSNFPKYDRNPNTGDGAQTATRLSVADQRVYLSAEFPSHLELEILE